MAVLCFLKIRKDLKGEIVFSLPLEHTVQAADDLWHKPNYFWAASAVKLIASGQREVQVLVCERCLRSVADSLTNSAAASVETAGGNTLNQELVKPISRFAHCEGVQPLWQVKVNSFSFLQKTKKAATSVWHSAVLLTRSFELMKVTLHKWTWKPALYVHV